MGIFLLGRAGLLESKRSSINIPGPDMYSYAFIDHLKQGDGFYGPDGVGFYTTTKPFQQSVDANGWVNDAAVSSVSAGGGPRIPGTDQFSGPYVLTWTGDGSVFINGPSQLTWTQDNSTASGNTSGTYTRSGNTWTNVVGQTARVIIKPSGCPGPMLLNIGTSSTGGVGGFLTNLKFYRYEDEADLIAGSIFRVGFKQALLANNPHHVRFLDWSNTNNSQLVRWEHRNLPTYASWTDNHGASGQPKYGITSNSNQMTLGSATGMPVAMQHGEIVTCRIGQTIANNSVAGGAVAISAIAKNSVGTVTTSVAHGYSTGDVIIHKMTGTTPGSLPAGMTQIHNMPCTITVLNSTQYQSNVNTTTGYSTFTVGTAYQYLTLNVGARGAYPIYFNDGFTPAGGFGSAFWTGGNYKALSFDKNFIGSTTVTGAWLIRSEAQSDAVLGGGVPYEVCTKLVNELMALTTRGPIHMYVTIPHRALTSHDPDYTSASNWSVNMVDCIINPSSTVRTSGWSALDSRCNLYVEHSNETWNNGTFDQAKFMAAMSYQTWPALGNDMNTYSSLRAVQAVNDIQAANPGSARIKYVLGMLTTIGPSDSRNAVRFNGNTEYTAAIGNANTPLSNFDYVAIAGYFSSDDSTPANSLSQCVSDWVAAGSNTALQDAAFAKYAAAYSTQSIGGNETISRYVTLLGDYATATALQSKKVIGYEGGVEPPFTINSTETIRGTFTNGANTITSIDGGQTPTVGYYVVATDGRIPALTTIATSSSGSATMSNNATISGTGAFRVCSPSDYFTLLFKRSTAWATAYRTWFDAWNSVSNAEAPAEFILYRVRYDRWSHTFFEDSYSGGVENAGFDAAWTALSTRNNG